MLNLEKIFSSVWWPVPLLCLVLALQYYYLSEPPELSSGSNKPQADEFQLPQLKELNPRDYTAITTRPLFHKSRRPQLDVVLSSTPTKATSTVSRLTPDHLQLTAIIITSEKRFAIFQDTIKRTRVKGLEGDQLGSWLLKTIKPAEVVLTRDQKTHTIQLRDNKARESENKRGSNTRRAQSRASQPREVRRPRRQVTQ